MDNEVQLRELADSPIFPPRSALNRPGESSLARDSERHVDHCQGPDNSSTLTGDYPDRADHAHVPPPPSESSSECTTHATGSSTLEETERDPLNSRRKLNFGRTGVLKFSRKFDRRDSPTKKPAGVLSSKDPQVLKSDKVFTVSAKDMSVLERIGHRAQHRAIRIRKPHEVFVELEEIRVDEADGLEWAETARWIKFEEDVEEGSGRWGRPHISALTFHSLVELQQGIDKGTVLLDIDGDNFPAIVDEIASSLEGCGQLEKDAVEGVRMALLKRHRHTGDTNFWGKKKSSNSDATHQAHQSHAHHHARDHTHHMVNRTTSGLPLLEEEGSEGSEHRLSGSGEAPPHPVSSGNSKKVSFSLTTPPLSNDITNTSSHSTISSHLSRERSSVPLIDGNGSKNPDTSVNLDSTDLKELETDLGEGDEERPVSPSPHGLRSLLRKSSIIDVIPKEAESITVMVGAVKFLENPVTVFVRLRQALILPSLFSQQSHLLGDLTEVPVPVRFLFLMIGPEDTTINYHEVGRCMATLMSDAHFHDIAYSAVCKEDLLEGMDKFLDDSIVLPPGDWDEDLLLPAMHERNELRRRKEHHQELKDSYKKMVVEPIHHSKRPFGGVYRDIKKLASRYISDYKDAFNLQVLVSIFFLYISFVAPAIAFGGLMEEVTNNHIGETETLFGAGLGGILYGLLAVQPLTVQAFVGPVLVYESIIYRFAVDYNLPYLEWRVLIGLWLMLILLFLALAELTFLVHYFTRFSEEVFIGITGFFFFYEACLSIVHIFERNPLCGLHYPCGKGAKLTNTCLPYNMSYSTMDPYYINYSNASAYDTMDDMMFNNTVEPSLPRGFRICNQPNTGLWSLILALTTFFIALFLRKLRYKKNLGKKARRLVSDFGMLTALTSMVLVAYFMMNLIPVEVLLVPPNYSVSDPSVRGWLLNPFNGSVSIGIGFGAFIPAALMAILIFIENQLALMTVNKPEHKLVKPVGYHLDLALVGLLSGVCGVLGLPFLCGAPVRSLQLLQALSVYTKKQAPGEKPTLVHIHEQRVVVIVVHFLISKLCWVWVWFKAWLRGVEEYWDSPPH